MAKLYFRYGAMGSSKTANAIMVWYNYHERGQRALLLKPATDTRDGVSAIRSRCGLAAECMLFDALDLDAVRAHAYDCLIVDEAQFLAPEQVDLLARIVDEYGVPVICYGLRTDFMGNFFPGSARLLACADTIEEIKTICQYCSRKATMVLRTQAGKPVYDGEQIQIGGHETYISVCRKHYFNPDIPTESV